METLSGTRNDAPGAAEAPESVDTVALATTLDLPPADVAPNARVHWSAKARAVRSQRAAAVYKLRPVRDEDGRLVQSAFRRPVVLHATFYTGPSAHYGNRDGLYRPIDRDNAIASLKATIDGLVDAGVIPNDRAETLRIGDVEIRRESPPRLELRLVEAAR